MYVRAKEGRGGEEHTKGRRSARTVIGMAAHTGTLSSRRVPCPPGWLSCRMIRRDRGPTAAAPVPLP